MIVNKKGRMTLKVIALSLLLPLPAFAADQQPQQPERWGQTFGRWGSNVRNYIGMGPSTLQFAGTLGALGLSEGLKGRISNQTDATIGLAGLFGAPLLANYMRLQQRQNQNPNDRSHWSSYMVNPVISAAAAGAAFAALYGLWTDGTCSLSDAARMAILTTVSAGLTGASSGYYFADQEPKRDLFKSAKDALVNYVTAVIDGSQIFNPNIFNNLTDEYTKTLKDMDLILATHKLTAEQLTQVTILNYLINEEWITKKDFHEGIAVNNPQGTLKTLKLFGEKYVLPEFDNMSNENLARVLFSQFDQKIIQNISKYQHHAEALFF